jgi:hypothetical protein
MRCDEADPFLDAFAEEALEPQEARAVADHVAACARCTRALAQARALSAVLARPLALAPTAAVDARVLAAVEEERRWAAFCRRTRNRIALAGLAVTALAVAGALLSQSAVPWVAGRAESLATFLLLWIRWQAIPALDAALPALVALVAAAAAVAGIERAVRPRRGRIQALARA